MDSLITAAARALAMGDPLGALKRVALREDAPALALRGIAMAQLGDLVRGEGAPTKRRPRIRAERSGVAREGASSPRPRSRSSRATWAGPTKALDVARTALEEHGDLANAAHARYLQARRLLLIGRIDEAERTLATVDPTPFPPAWRTAHELLVAGIGMRRLRTSEAREALARAASAARHAGIPALTAEGRKRTARPEYACCTPDCRWRGTTPAARRRRSVAGVESLRSGRLPLCRTPRGHGDLAREASGVVRARSRVGRGVA